MRWLALLTLTFASPALATTDAYPALYDVIGVASDDVLNIRATPDAGSEIIGSLAHDAENIEVIRPNDDFSWAHIITGPEGMGWVSLDYLAPQPGQWDGLYPDFTTCYGTEPFWNLNRKDGTLTFSGLDLPTVTAAIQHETSPLGHRGRHGFSAGGMVGVLSNQLCNDGMTDVEFGWELNLIFPADGEHYQGCCSLQPHAE